MEVGLCLSPLLFYFDLRIKSWEVGVETAMSSRMAIKEEREREREMGDGRWEIRMLLLSALKRGGLVRKLCRRSEPL